MRKPANHKTGGQNTSVCIEMCIELHSQKVPKEAQCIHTDTPEVRSEVYTDFLRK